MRVRHSKPGLPGPSRFFALALPVGAKFEKWTPKFHSELDASARAHIPAPPPGTRGSRSRQVGIDREEGSGDGGRATPGQSTTLSRRRRQGTEPWCTLVSSARVEMHEPLLGGVLVCRLGSAGMPRRDSPGAPAVDPWRRRTAGDVPRLGLATRSAGLGTSFPGREKCLCLGKRTASDRRGRSPCRFRLR